MMRVDGLDVSNNNHHHYRGQRWCLSSSCSRWGQNSFPADSVVEAPYYSISQLMWWWWWWWGCMYVGGRRLSCLMIFFLHSPWPWRKLLSQDRDVVPWLLPLLTWLLYICAVIWKEEEEISKWWDGRQGLTCRSFPKTFRSLPRSFGNLPLYLLFTKSNTVKLNKVFSYIPWNPRSETIIISMSPSRLYTHTYVILLLCYTYYRKS